MTTVPDPWPAPRADAPVDAVVTLPGSKSLTNRALVLAAIADGPSVVRRALRSRDTSLMAAALTALGSHVDTSGADWVVTPGAFTADASVDCGLAGTVMRFVPPVAGLSSGTVAFDGDPHMRKRPVGEVLTALRALGVEVDDGGRGALPFTVHGHGAVPGGRVVVDASASSQFVSALLLAGARYERGVDVRHDGKPVPSLPHIEMTVAMLREHGVAVDDADANRWAVAPGPVAALDRLIEPDLSNAAPFLALAAVTGGSVTVRDWPRGTTQAGDALREILAGMGCEVTLGDEGLLVRGTGSLHGIDVDLHDVGELTPAVAALCALADSPSHLRGIAPHPRPRDRPARRAGHRAGRPGGRRHRARRRSQPAPGAAARRGLPHLRRPPDGPRRRDRGGRGGRRPGRGHRHHRQDVPGLRGLLVGAAVSGTTGRYGEHDQEHYERPRRRTRPRTKDRPTYDDAVDGVVVTVDRGRYTLLVDDTKVMAMKARPLGRKGVVVGDRVRVVGDTSGVDGALARIVEVTPRVTTLRRTADDDDPVERVIVSNAEQLVVVTALADPEPQPRLIDRALVAAYDAGMQPLLCLTKADLADPETLLSTYRSLGVPWVVTERGGDLAPLRERLSGKTSVMVGSSGVGKSTLVNALVPGALREVGIVNVVTGRGRHTSTSAFMLALPDNEGWIIDTPGIRSFGLAHVQPEDLIGAFPDLDELTEDCPRGCTHGTDEPECGLDEAISEGRADPDRVSSFRRLLAARSEPVY